MVAWCRGILRWWSGIWATVEVFLPRIRANFSVWHPIYLQRQAAATYPCYPNTKHHPSMSTHISYVLTGIHKKMNARCRGILSTDLGNSNSRVEVILPRIGANFSVWQWHPICSILSDLQIPNTTHPYPTKIGLSLLAWTKRSVTVDLPSKGVNFSEWHPIYLQYWHANDPPKNQKCQLTMIQSKPHW